MFDYSASEWQSFSKTERRIIILARDYLLYAPEKSFHDEMRVLLNWPLPEPINERTYKGHWSRLTAKMHKINAARAKRIDCAEQ